MIAQLHGILLEKQPRSCCINVNGVGYEVLCTSQALAENTCGESVVFFTYLHVRENVLNLYGFKSSEEKQIFQWLIDFPGIGPKSALNILETVSYTVLIEAVRIKQDVGLLYAHGLGKKTAEKIFTGLKDKLAADGLVSSLPSFEYQEVVDALLSLGYNRASVLPVMSLLPPTAQTLEEKIRKALQMLQKR